MRRFVDDWLYKVDSHTDPDVEPADPWDTPTMLQKAMYSTWQKSSQATLAWAGIYCVHQVRNTGALFGSNINTRSNTA